MSFHRLLLGVETPLEALFLEIVTWKVFLDEKSE